ncbi:uncharacterized protein SPSC_01963 [Sporisorium scitamineum]|uniref:DDE Tnp4 domain-containing protein n=1 Tax=Sporisorium scitamineum TaxID=49012 RepID=A0A0F7S5Q8_9BASI|nr:uncharacterized protein SPSC_01963 [Sporisorium scitamineum]CDW98267.1 hypothetical protein [Sporisorium scitamineum]
MVRYSEKDLFLHEVEDAIVVARMLELQRHDDKVSDSSSSLSGDDESSSSDSESWLDSDDEPDHTLSNHLIQAHCLITQERYLVDREHDLTDSGRIMRLLDRYASTNVKLYRGMVRMSPEAFEDLTERLRSTNAFRSTIDFNRVRLQIAVGLYRMGRSGNGGGVRDIAIQCGCSWGSVHSWTAKTIEGLNELNKEVMTFATEDERARAKAWVQEKSGVEAWGRGWLAAGGTHINLAWKPALNAREHWSYKGDYTFNVALVVLPHSLRIVESVVGHPGSSHDSRVWASGTHGIVAKFRLHLDEGEFVWVDAGYGYSSYTVGPYGHKNSEKSRDLKHFNYMLSRIRIRAEHGIGYLKGRFQCLSGYRGNLYREYDHRQAALAIQACIIAHTFASRYDRPDDVAEYLKDQSSTGETAPEPSYEDATEEARRVRRDNQIQFEEDLATATAGFTPSQLSKYRADAALDLREEMTVALFEEHGRDFQDTTVESRRQGMSTASLELQRSRYRSRTAARRAQRASQA